MRSLMLILLMTSVSLAQEPPSGYSFADENETQITLEVRFLSGPIELFRPMRKESALRTPAAKPELALANVSDETLNQGNGIHLVSASTTVETRTPVFVEKLKDDAVRKLLHTVQEHERGNILLAPKVTLFNRQTAVIEDTTTHPFVVGLESGGQAPQPRIGAFDEGTKIIVRCQMRPQNSIRIDFRARLSSVEEVGLLDAGPSGAVIQVPQVDARDIQLAAHLPIGQTLVVRGLPKEVVHRVEAGVPMLDKVPYVSRMFKNTGVAIEHEELVILLTTRICEETGIK